MIPILYKETETNFNHNGLGLLKDCLTADVTEVRNGEFSVFIEYPMAGSLSDEVYNFRFVKVKPNDSDEPHVFKIYNFEKDSQSDMVRIYAYSKSNDLGKNVVRNVIINNSNAQQALNSLKANLEEPTDYLFYSDITATSSTEWTNRNALNCIAGEEGSMIDNWGGEVKRENYMIRLLRQRGNTNVVTLRDGKNIRGLQMKESIEGLVTRMIPYFREDDGNGNETIRWGNVVDSPLINNYPHVSVVTEDYTGDVETVSELNQEAAGFFVTKEIDKPNVSIDVDIQELSMSTEFAEFKHLEQIGLCDTLTVYSKKYKVNVNAKVNTLVYDALRERNSMVSIGTYQTGLINDIRQRYEDVAKQTQRTLEHIVQIAANGKNRIYRGTSEPTLSMTVNDLWYRPVGDGETELYTYDGTQWQLEKVSAGLLGGTLDAENGDVNLINVNVANIVGETSEFVRSAWNGITTQISISAANGIQSTGANGDAVRFTNGEIEFQRGAQGRHLLYNPEGLILEPFTTNTGTSMNTSLHLKTIVNAAENYIHFEDPQFSHRIRQISSILNIDHSTAGELRIRDRSGADGTIRARILSTRDGSDTVGNRIMMIGDRLQTPRDGLRDIYLSPNGQGKVRVANVDRDYYPIRASDFENASSRELKTAIEPYRGSALDVINGLDVVEYYMKKDIREGHYNRYVGLISEDSPEVASQDGQSIMSYAVDAYLIKAVQELSNQVRELESNVTPAAAD